MGKRKAPSPTASDDDLVAEVPKKARITTDSLKTDMSLIASVGLKYLVQFTNEILSRGWSYRLIVKESVFCLVCHSVHINESTVLPGALLNHARRTHGCPKNCQYARIVLICLRKNDLPGGWAKSWDSFVPFDGLKEWIDHALPRERGQRILKRVMPPKGADIKQFSFARKLGFSPTGGFSTSLPILYKTGDALEAADRAADELDIMACKQALKRGHDIGSAVPQEPGPPPLTGPHEYRTMISGRLLLLDGGAPSDPPVSRDLAPLLAPQPWPLVPWGSSPDLRMPPIELHGASPIPLLPSIVGHRFLQDIPPPRIAYPQLHHTPYQLVPGLPIFDHGQTAGLQYYDPPAVPDAPDVPPLSPETTGHPPVQANGPHVRLSELQLLQHRWDILRQAPHANYLGQPADSVNPLISSNRDTLLPFRQSPMSSLNRGHATSNGGLSIEGVRSQASPHVQPVLGSSGATEPLLSLSMTTMLPPAMRVYVDETSNRQQQRRFSSERPTTNSLQLQGLNPWMPQQSLEHALQHPGDVSQELSPPSPPPPLLTAPTHSDQGTHIVDTYLTADAPTMDFGRAMDTMYGYQGAPAPDHRPFSLSRARTVPNITCTRASVSRMPMPQDPRPLASYNSAFEISAFGIVEPGYAFPSKKTLEDENAINWTKDGTNVRAGQEAVDDFRLAEDFGAGVVDHVDLSDFDIASNWTITFTEGGRQVKESLPELPELE